MGALGSLQPTTINGCDTSKPTEKIEVDQNTLYINNNLYIKRENTTSLISYTFL